MASSSVSKSAAGSSKCNDKATQTLRDGAAGSSRKHKKASRSSRDGVAGKLKHHAKAIKKVARLVEELEKSNADWARKIDVRQEMNDRLRGQRDDWRQRHKAQEREKMELEAEIRRGREREEELLVKYNAERAKNQRIKERVELLQNGLSEIKAEMRETGEVRIIGEEDRFVLSPVEDFEACRQAKFRHLVHGPRRGGQPAAGSLRSRVRTF